jgi:hypothetical protein
VGLATPQRNNVLGFVTNCKPHGLYSLAEGFGGISSTHWGGQKDFGWKVLGEVITWMI